MQKTLLFLPDISGFTEFIQSTEVEHSQHVIAEILELLIASNKIDLKLAEVEGDALFFYRSDGMPSPEEFMDQIEEMFKVFYGHLDLLKKNRICPCNACATAPDLDLKIIAHCGEVQFIAVQGKKKPFGPEVIEAHRLMKNSVDSDRYVLLSQKLTEELYPSGIPNRLALTFDSGTDVYDGKEISYHYAPLDLARLDLPDSHAATPIAFEREADLKSQKEFPVSAERLLEYISNFSYRGEWVKGVNSFEFDPNEVNRLGTEHACVIDRQTLDFTTITKEVEEGKLIYGEMTSSPAPVDTLYQFYIITPLGEHSAKLDVEVFIKAESFFKRILVKLIVKSALKKNLEPSLDRLHAFISEQNSDR